MEQNNRYRPALRQVSIGRVGAGALAISGILALGFAVSVDGSVTNHLAKRVVISSETNAKFGTILASGNTLYVLKPGATACKIKCLNIWPPVLLPGGVLHATAGAGVSAAKLGTVKRLGGALQVTYAGRALYWFSGDTARGQVKGIVKDIWGTWSVVVIKARSSGSGGTTTTSPGKPVPTTSPTTTVVKSTTTTAASGGGGGVGF
jgi:predicted lipoprotein with Yx(FWY)xxD motif